MLFFGVIAGNPARSPHAASFAGRQAAEQANDRALQEVSVSFIRHPKDFYAGLLFVAFGVAALVIGSNYPLGTAARMGPGYFPRILGILLVGLGLLLALRALKIVGPNVPKFQWRPLLVVLGSVVLFGFIVAHVGLLISTIVLIFTASAASHEFRWKEALVSGVFFALLAIGVFVVGLKLQLPIWPPFITGH